MNFVVENKNINNSFEIQFIADISGILLSLLNVSDGEPCCLMTRVNDYKKRGEEEPIHKK